MATHGMTVCKPSQEDFDATLTLLQDCEEALENGRYNGQFAEEKWLDWDDEDPNKILCLKIQSQVAREERIGVDDVDNRIIMFEFLQQSFAKAATGWRRVYMAAEVLTDNVQDPNVGHLAFHPGFEFLHVANEQ